MNRSNSNRSGKKPNYTPKPQGTKKPFKKTSAPKKTEKPVVKENPDEIRLNRYIANSGICSRRDADIYMRSGNVKVNGEVITEMGFKVKPGDVVNFDGTEITPGKKEYYLLNNDEKKIYLLPENESINNLSNETQNKIIESYNNYFSTGKPYKKWLWSRFYFR